MTGRGRESPYKIGHIWTTKGCGKKWPSFIYVNFFCHSQLMCFISLLFLYFLIALENRKSRKKDEYSNAILYILSQGMKCMVITFV